MQNRREINRESLPRGSSSRRSDDGREGEEKGKKRRRKKKKNCVTDGLDWLTWADQDIKLTPSLGYTRAGDQWIW